MSQKLTRESTSQEKFQVQAINAKQASRSLDQLRMCLAAGLSVPSAVAEVSRMTDSHPLIKQLDLEMSNDPVSALRKIHTEYSPFSAAAYLLERSFITGAPLHSALGTLSEQLRRAVTQETTRKVRGVGVKAVLPLGFCFLPAFVLLTVIPIAVGLFSQISW